MLIIAKIQVINWTNSQNIRYKNVINLFITNVRPKKKKTNILVIFLETDLNFFFFQRRKVNLNLRHNLATSNAFILNDMLINAIFIIKALYKIP